VLLTLDEKDPKRLFEGSALLKRLTTYGLLDDTKQKVRFRYLEPRSAAQDGGRRVVWASAARLEGGLRALAGRRTGPSCERGALLLEEQQWRTAAVDSTMGAHCAAFRGPRQFD
jgi:hypothetical protein